jgi:hypothetical protein
MTKQGIKDLMRGVVNEAITSREQDRKKYHNEYLNTMEQLSEHIEMIDQEIEMLETVQGKYRK